MPSTDETRANKAKARMRQAVEKLALPAPKAQSHALQRMQRPDQLAFEFEAAYNGYIDTLRTLPTPAQLAALQCLDAELLSMSGIESSALWTETSLAKHPQWQRIREFAEKVLDEFGWQ